MSWGDVYDFRQKRARETFTITEKKTGKTKTVAIHKNVADTLQQAAAKSFSHEFLFSNPKTGLPLTRCHAYRLIREAGKEVGISGRVSCHSLRKTFGYHAWNNGISPVVLMEIFNHSSQYLTRRYLGVHQDNLNAVYTGLKFH